MGAAVTATGKCESSGRLTRAQYGFVILMIGDGWSERGIIEYIFALCSC